MPVFSIVIPAYNNSRYLPECVRSVTGQSFADLEVIIVDDASTDDTYEVMERLASADPRVVALRHDANAGTLASRRTGVEASRGDYVLLVDQDDELAPGTLERLHDHAAAHEADIYHYGVRVEAATDAARRAARGMAGFLTPEPRTLRGASILATQFAQQGGFDWHVHHKMFRGDLARRAYGMSADTRLLLSDDLYMCFILDSLADTYEAIPDSPWYVYHLGRGETLGARLTPEAFATLAERDAKALRLISDFVAGHRDGIHRSDWDERVADVRDRLIEHTMNEWQDNLAAQDKPAGLAAALRCWAPDAVCGELYRYVRDYAYAYLVADDRTERGAQADKERALSYLAMTEGVERRYAAADHAAVSGAGSGEDAAGAGGSGATAHTPGTAHALPTTDTHYLELRSIARSHLADSGLIAQPAPAAPDSPGAAAAPRRHGVLSGLRRLAGRLLR